jgi:Protein of unknown function DUF262/Protein of unknown function (DUF1524)
MTTFGARNCTLKEILTLPQPLKIPIYQRHYEWTLAEMDKLLADLVESFVRAASKPSTYHFMGSVLLHEHRDLKDPQENRDHVIDGQQRLTSLSMILAAGRDLLTDTAQQKLIDVYLTIPANSLIGQPPAQRLKLHRGDQNFYDAHVVPIGATAASVGPQNIDSHEQMRRNCKRARDWLETRIVAADLPRFINFVASNCRLILLTVTDAQDAVRMFRTINSRGRKLAEEEMVRFTLVEFATEKETERDMLLRKWDTVERRVGQHDMPRFIGQLRAQRTRGFTSTNDLDHDMKASFPTSADAKAFQENDLLPQADVFVEIADCLAKGMGTSTEKRQIDRVLRSLALVDFVEWVPIAVQLIQRYRVHPQQLLGYMKALDRLVWFYYLRRDDINIAGDRQKRLGDVLFHIGATQIFDPDACKFNLGPTERAEMRGIIKNNIDPKWVPLKALLIRFEQALAFNKAQDFSRGFSIEHILPQDPSDRYWLTTFGDYAACKRYSGMIGNLCLVPYRVNTMLGSLSFPAKNAIAKAENVAADARLAADLESEADWTPGVIDRRSKWLMTVFCDQFDVHAP